MILPITSVHLTRIFTLQDDPGIVLPVYDSITYVVSHETIQVVFTDWVDMVICTFDTGLIRWVISCRGKMTLSLPLEKFNSVYVFKLPVHWLHDKNSSCVEHCIVWIITETELLGGGGGGGGAN